MDKFEFEKIKLKLYTITCQVHKSGFAGMAQR